MTTSSRFVYVHDESLSNRTDGSLLPILEGYKQQPTVSLEEAVIPINHLFINIDDYVQLARSECENPKNNLTQDESASIYLYTCEFTAGDSLYRILNKTLRAAEQQNDALKPWLPFLKLFITVLCKLPSKSEAVYRGVRSMDINQTDYQTNKRFQWLGVTSCTTTIDTLKSPQFLGGAGERRTLFSIHCLTGRSVVAHSALKDTEKEVILLPGTWFRVSGHLNVENGLHIIQLREIQPSPFMNIIDSASTNQDKTKIENDLTMIAVKLIQPSPFMKIIDSPSTKHDKIKPHDDLSMIALQPIQPTSSKGNFHKNISSANLHDNGNMAIKYWRYIKARRWLQIVIVLFILALIGAMIAVGVTQTQTTPQKRATTATAAIEIVSVSTTATTTTSSTTGINPQCNTIFLPQTTYSTGNGSHPAFVLAVDVNSDNKPDIIVANYYGFTVGVLLNSGNGTFLPQTTYSTGTLSYPIAMSVVDINSGNKPDIIVVNSWASNIGVFFNSGNGTFLHQTSYLTGNGSYPIAVSVVDVNTDSKPDIIVANSFGDNVGVFLNSGNGAFLPQTTYFTGNGSYPVSVSVVDVNNDSKPDIIVANTNKYNVGVLFNSGNGTFLPQTTYSTGNDSYPASVSVVDVNSDSKPDFIVANNGGYNVGVLLACYN